MCVTLFEVEDFDAVIRVLQGKGIAIERPGSRHDGQRYLCNRNPDGKRVESCTPFESSPRAHQGPSDQGVATCVGRVPGHRA
jgi:hypothetical protein